MPILSCRTSTETEEEKKKERERKGVTYASGAISIAAAFTVDATPASHANSCVARTMMALVLHRMEESRDSKASAKKAQANSLTGFPTFLG